MMLFLSNHIRRRGLSCSGREAESRCRLCFYGLPREETSEGEGEGYGDVQRKWNKLHKNWIISTDNANGKTCRSPERYDSRFVILVRQTTRLVWIIWLPATVALLCPTQVTGLEIVQLAGVKTQWMNSCQRFHENEMDPYGLHTGSIWEYGSNTGSMWAGCQS